jgi:hypothetical protein
MKSFNRKRWAEGWLRGIADAVRNQRMAPKTLTTAIGRARQSGLTDEEIDRLLTTAAERLRCAEPT